MVFIRNLILCSLCMCLFLPSLKAMENEDSQEYHPILRINSLNQVKEDVKNLLNTMQEKGLQPKNLCVVLDFHGVIVDEESHPTSQQKLTLKEGIIELLQYLKDTGVSYLVATAWIPFQDVIQSIVDLKLQNYFSVEPDHIAELEDFELGQKKEKFKGYKNGRVVALKYKASYKASLFDSEADSYFRQKAYTIELCYPGTEIINILFVDDSEENGKQFREDTGNITQTANGNFGGLHLYYLENPKKQKPKKAFFFPNERHDS